MANTSNNLLTPRSVRDLLADLRRRIRWYVIAEGVAVLVVWLGAAFWSGLAIDYLPVLVGANEMPRNARLGLLICIAGVALYLCYRLIFRRLFHRLHDSSLALLIERRFPSFRDSLVTTIEKSSNSSAAAPVAYSPADQELLADVSLLPDHRDMLAQTIARAAAGVPEVKLRRVFSFRPLLTKSVGALAVIASLVLLGVLSRQALWTGVSRLVLLSSEPWPRRARIELVGFVDGRKKVAKGSDLILRVRADATRELAPPDVCTILYASQDGDRGRVNMSRDGEPRDGFQYYVYNGKPFKSMLDNVHFDVIGYDYRLRDQWVDVVPSPVVVRVQLHSQLPAYTGLLPRDEDWAPGTQLAIGSRIEMKIAVSKSLRTAVLKDIDTGLETTIEFDASASEPAGLREFSYSIERLEARHAVAISLLDTDGIESSEPYLLTIGAVQDSIPDVEIALRGIGNEITPVARLPMEGRVRDDYGVRRSWFDLKIGDATREFDFEVASDEEFTLALDLRDEAAAERPHPLELKPQDRITFAVKARDGYDLDSEPHIGSSDPIVLTVVRPDELLAILDGRELSLRRRFEQIRSEVAQSRDSLVRLRSSWEESPVEGELPNEEARNNAERNLTDLQARWAQWAGQKAEQSALEIAGVAVAFEDIREELINNRVDTPERKSRLEQQIIAPLRHIADELYPEFKTALSELQATLEDDALAVPKSKLVVEQADEILLAMDAVLEKMLELEDYAELVNMVRAIIQQQTELEGQTKEEQQRRLLDFLK